MKVWTLSWIMDKAIDIHRKNLLSVTLFQLVFSLISIAVVFGSILIGGIFISIGSITLLNTTSVVLRTVGIIFAVTSSIILFTFVSSVVVVSGAGIMEVTQRGLRGRKTLTGQALSFAFKNFFRVVSVIVVLILLFLPLIGLWGGIGYGSFVLLSKSTLTYIIKYNFTQNSIPVIMLVILFLLLVFASITWYFNIHIFCFHTAVFQKKSFFKALSESRRLVINNFWRVFAYNLMFSLSVVAIYYSVDSFALIVGGLIGLLLEFLNISNDIFVYLQGIWVVAAWPLRIFEQLFIAPIYSFFISILYFILRYEKDGYDLELKLEEIKSGREEGKLQGEI